MAIKMQQSKQALLATATLLFVLMLVMSWLFHGTGVVHNDAKRNINIPQELTLPLQVKAAYNGDRIFFRYRWPAQHPSIHHDVLKFEGGQWKTYGSPIAGTQPQGLHEDRVTMLVDDGSVPEFEHYGGYITVGDRLAAFTRHAAEKDVKAHAYLGAKKGQTEVTKYLPETRTDINNWASVVSEEKLAAQRKAGYFLDLWHWRAQRSNPLDMSDDQFVADGRYSDKGRSMASANWDAAKKQPRFMFDADKNGGRTAMAWDALIQGKLGFDDAYFIREDQAKPFDPAYPWKEGDVLPRRSLRIGDGSVADIAVSGTGRWKDGFWDVTLMRAMDTGNPQDDKIFTDHRVYTIAFAVHRNATGGRWHYVSLPASVGLDRQARIKAARFEGDTPKWEQAWNEVQLFYPGQVSWPLINSRKHPGADKVKQGVPVKFRHSEIQLAHYGVEMEFNDEIRRHWLYTLIAGVLLIAGFGIALYLMLPQKEV
jgi:Ethylbenzene dehydrogenase